MLSIGDLVYVSDLRVRGDLNNRMGQVCAELRGDRVGLRMLVGHERVRALPRNLTRVTGFSALTREPYSTMPVAELYLARSVLLEADEIAAASALPGSGV